jgi:GH25 family lysozyme M1 (1,4-beta-N-acetylmuramidase)
MYPFAVPWVAAALALLLPAGCESLDPVPEGAVGVQPFPLTQICPHGETIEGIDVSYWQETIDWDTLAAGDVNFVIMRASVNLSEDSNFDVNWAGARRVGIIRGAYHYFHPDVDAAAQAETFLAAMGPLEADDLPPTLDVEEDDGAPPPDQYAAGVRTWLDMVEAATGRVPMIYCTGYFWESRVQATDMADHPFWAAHWGVTCPNVPTPWTDWAFHQYDVTDAGTVPGITTRIDRDVFNGTMDDLLDFLSVTPVCGDGRCNGGETWETCPDDCPRCEPIPPEGRIVDESEVCFGTTPSSGRTPRTTPTRPTSPGGASTSRRRGSTGSRPTPRLPGPSRSRPPTRSPTAGIRTRSSWTRPQRTDGTRSASFYLPPAPTSPCTCPTTRARP